MIHFNPDMLISKFWQDSEHIVHHCGGLYAMCFRLNRILRGVAREIHDDLRELE